MQEILLKNVHVVDPTTATLTSCATVHIRDGVLMNPSSCDPDRTIDCDGSQSGFSDARPDSLDLRQTFPYANVVEELRTTGKQRFFPAYLGSGITSAMDVGGFPWTVTEYARPSDNDLDSPRIIATGPLISTIDFPLANTPTSKQFLYVADEDAARQSVRWLVDRDRGLGVSTVKCWFIPTPDKFETQASVMQAAAVEAKSLGARVCVHATGLAEALRALQFGCDFLVHSVDDAEIGRNFVELCTRQRVVLCPTLTVMQGYAELSQCLFDGSVPTVDDPHSLVDPITRRRLFMLPQLSAPMRNSRFFSEDSVIRSRTRTLASFKRAAQNLRKLQDGGVEIAMGTDAGNPLTLHGVSVFRELRAMSEDAHLSNADILRSATVGGARAMGRDDIGLIAPGKAADLVLLRENPLERLEAIRSIEWTMRGGKIHRMSELSQRAGSVRVPDNDRE